ncbi:hypothetical protein [Micromonospora sp. MA102]|uniref:hypothetical protein n=1 Tax=Micromonospora sp. MA102 TaxID=2952755 RepID=UPI0021CA1BF9|nr:hypothetical protein [Micromonospora sp. MA102]
MFHDLLAAEEGIDLKLMDSFGGNRSWDSISTPMRLLFDLDYVRGQHPTTNYPEVAARLRELHERWSKGAFASNDPALDPLRQHVTARLEQLAQVVEECVRTNARLVIR